MNVGRDDKMDVTRAADTIKSNESNDSLPNETPEKADENTPSLTFSSERFNFSAFAEENIGCIDKAGSMFKELKKKPPTLREALESMGYNEKAKKLIEMFMEKANGRLEEIDAPGLTVDDVAAIFCYTYEGGVDSPYRKLNKSISVERSNPALRKTRAFLFLLLQALRKLPRYTPVNKTLYRGINIHIQTEVDPEHPDTKPYTAGNEKTWWTFTSTTEDLEVTRYFVENNKNKKGTLFTLSGEAWGYDISVFSNFPNEKEILLEPERRLKIKDVKKEDAVIAVNAEILDTPLVLKDYIKVKPVKIKERNSSIKEVPRNLRVESITESTVTLLWDAPEKNGKKVLSYQVSARQTSDKFINRNPESTYIVKKEAKEEEAKDIERDSEEKKGEIKYTVKDLEEGKEYEFRVRCKYNDGWGKEWSEKKVVRVAYECVWKTCPDDVNDNRKYSVHEGNSRVATKINSNDDCTIIGNTLIPLNKVTSWSIKILKSRDNNGYNIAIGIALSDINQNDNNYKCGWYYDCCSSLLYSGPPHSYRGKEYGPRKREGQYVHTGDSVGVVMDTAKGDLSFVLNGVNRGVAYCGIPLDKPLVPCVLLWCKGDSVELDLSEVKENVDSSVPVPSNITTKSTTWGSITLTWDEVKRTSFYQIEVDGSNLCDIATTNTFTKRGLLPETEHSFSVRTVRGSSVSEWSGVVKGKTLKAPEFSECVWEECPGDVDKDKKYSVDKKNPRIAAKVNSNGYCTIIGNTYIPLNKVTQWIIKIFKSKDNDEDGIYIGIAPSDINQNDKYNYEKCGWYFDCYKSVLRSGPPHNYKENIYGPRKEDGQYVHTGDSVGVVVDTTRGNLSFVLNGVNLGVVYERIPLDKPLVPCVILWYAGDSVELELSEVKDNVDNSIPIPSNITVKSTTWDSITLTWDEVVDTSFYQVEVDGSKLWSAATKNLFIKRELLPETEHSFRVRTVRKSSVGEWSDVMKVRTLKAPEFSECVWKECPGDVDDNRKYSVDKKNLRIASKMDGDDWCTIIGNTHIPLNKATSWSIKIHKSRDNNGDRIYIGVAPSDINQNDVNYGNGWYFDCYYSTLRSGPPHKYYGKEYGPRKEKNGQYVHTGDSIGVVVDTTRGDLSFVLNGVNRGVAYDGISLDKPLVPCVLLYYKGDSVELVI